MVCYNVLKLDETTAFAKGEYISVGRRFLYYYKNGSRLTIRHIVETMKLSYNDRK